MRHLRQWSGKSGSCLESGTIVVNHYGRSGRVFATWLMLFCAGDVVHGDVAVGGVFLVGPVCSLQMSYTALSLLFWEINFACVNGNCYLVMVTAMQDNRNCTKVKVKNPL